MSRRLLALPLALLGLLLTAPSAFAVGPSAIGAGTDGTSYVGYPITGGIQRFGADGTALAPWGSAGPAAGQLGGIVGISVAAGTDGHVWVLDTNLRVQEFTKGGVFVKGVQLSACESGYTPDATRFGGIDVRVDGASTNPVAVYVAHPCANTVLKLDPASPTLATTQTATTSSRPGRLSVPRYLTGPANLMNVWVVLPTSGGTTGSVTGLTPTTLAAVAGTTRDYDFTPSDIFADEFGNTFIGDVTNNGIRERGSQNEQANFYGGTGSEPGRLNAPQAFDRTGETGDGLSRNFFIADTGNERVQRWNYFAGTIWTAAATGTPGGPAVQAPTNTGVPTISGSPVVGQTLTCAPGTWTGSPAFTYSWRRDGNQVATGATYPLVTADVGKAITCRVTGTNSAGNAAATSAAVTPTAPVAQAPVSTGAPTISGDTKPGAVLTCSDGTWNNSPTSFAKQWLRGTTVVGTGNSYGVAPADVGTQVTCKVTATNATGSATATSGAVTPSWNAPVNTGAPQIQGSAEVGQPLTCTQGSWAWFPTTFAYSWRRDGGEVATGSTYTLAAADAGRSITCVVTASNPGGAASSTSGAVNPPAPPATPAPQNTERPGIQGTTVVGNTLTCTPGAWTGSPSSYAYSWRRDGAAIAGATGSTYALVAADAGKTITCTSTASNSGGATTAVSDGVSVTAAPVVPSTRVGVTINNGAEATNTATVSLRIREPLGATAVVLSNDGSFDTPTQVPVAANDTYSWTLDARGSQKRARVVYVRFVGGTLDSNQTFQDDILLDTSAPTVTTATISARSTAKSATVRVAATDSGSGVQTIQYSATKSAGKAKTLKLTKSRSFKVKPKNAKWVRAVDVAGNKSKWKRISYKAPKGKR